MTSPVTSIMRAFAVPMRFGSCQAMPSSAIRPRCGKMTPTLASFAAKMRSAPSASERPTPTQPPFTAAMMGLSDEKHISSIRLMFHVFLDSATAWRRVRSSGVSVAGSKRPCASAPAQKARPLPVKTITRQSGSELASLMAILVKKRR